MQESDTSPTQINGGQFTCAYCRNVFRERRYQCKDADDEETQWFCLPECLAGYEWYVRARNMESPEEREQCKQDIRSAFGRNVFPAPFSCYWEGQEKRSRLQWLQQECWSRLKDDKDLEMVQRELLVFNNGSI